MTRSSEMAPAERRTRFRWIVVALLFVIFFLNYIDRAALSYAVPTIRREFNLDDRVIGLILGAFGVGYLATTLIGGALVDRVGSRRVLSAAALLWSVAIGIPPLLADRLVWLLPGRDLERQKGRTSLRWGVPSGTGYRWASVPQLWRPR